ncbi:MAG: SUMF1/EgtB/PvdO family nonheme iron enzyme [Deltaproteobacteria bacterium]|nr:SUMF1/EgtB/PvdO family nonheme iron enzyme [Deltaproteobacteria bacterium]
MTKHGDQQGDSQSLTATNRAYSNRSAGFVAGPHPPGRGPKRPDIPDPEAMKNRPVRASGEVDASLAFRDDSIPEDSIGGVHALPAPDERDTSLFVRPIRPRGPQSPSPSAREFERTQRITIPAQFAQAKPAHSRHNLRTLFWALSVSFIGLAAVAGGLAAWKIRSTRLARKKTAQKIKLVRLRKELAKNRLALPPGQCHLGMVWISNGRKRGFCIDLYEFPNKKGTVPTTVADNNQAHRICAQQGKRLCTAAEWRRACGGRHRHKYPYGRRYDPTKCVTSLPQVGPSNVQPSGARPSCRSPEGMFDMSGNVAEWVADGVLMGGSAALSGSKTSCRAQGGGGSPAYYGTRCCLSSL